MRLSKSHPEWVLGFEDEVWFSRYAQPSAATWTPDKPMRLVQNEPDKTDKEEPSPSTDCFAPIPGKCCCALSPGVR